MRMCKCSKYGAKQQATFRTLGLRDTIGFNLNEPFGIDEVLHLNKGGRWPDGGEKLPVGASCGFPLHNISQHNAGPNNSFQREAGFCDRLGNDVETAAGLAIDVLRFARIGRLLESLMDAE
jgi:hypothetical protein